jgi:hypothetical protein
MCQAGQPMVECSVPPPAVVQNPTIGCPKPHHRLSECLTKFGAGIGLASRPAALLDLPDLLRRGRTSGAAPSYVGYWQGGVIHG